MMPNPSLQSSARKQGRLGHADMLVWLRWQLPPEQLLKPGKEVIHIDKDVFLYSPGKGSVPERQYPRLRALQHERVLSPLLGPLLRGL